MLYSLSICNVEQQWLNQLVHCYKWLKFDLAFKDRNLRLNVRCQDSTCFINFISVSHALFYHLLCSTCSEACRTS